MPSNLVLMPRKKRNDLAVKIEADIIVKARTICSYRSITLAEYLSEFLRGPVEKDFERFKAQLGQEPRKPKGE